MIAKKMQPLVANNSAVRTMFEEGTRLRALYGDEAVYDFSLGNPNAPAPAAVKKAITDILEEEDSTFVHGYMSNAGYPRVRRAVADSINRRFGTHFGEDNILMTVGAASGLNVALKTLLDPGDEVIVFAPYFLEYSAYVANYDGKVVEVAPDPETFLPNLAEFAQKITARTRAVIVNTPHNPTGVVYPEEVIRQIASILTAREEEFGQPIFLISDEPYRELVYDGLTVPYIPKYYANTIVCYSFSKSLSLPGERIGYLVIPDELEDSAAVFETATIANRVIGSVNAPSLMQLVVEKCIDEPCDVAFYDRNRHALYDGLTALGFSCVRPQGAFYLFVKSPEPDERAFCEKAKKYNILAVPGRSFAYPGYVRLAYCVSYGTIRGSLPAFAKLADDYGLKK